MLMSQQSRVSLRCPVCLSRDIDVVLYHDGERYYCIKCSYTGQEDEIREMYAGIRRKFRWVHKRLSVEDIKAL
jgi:ribosomal protein S27AE